MPDPLHSYDKQIAGEIWTSDVAYRTLEHLCDVIGSRWAGSDSEHATAEYCRDRFTDDGLQNVRLEPVAFDRWTRGHCDLAITSPETRTFSAIALPYSPDAEIEASLIDAGNGEEEDFERLGDAVRGKVALVAAETDARGGDLAKLAHRKDKLRFAADSGAVAIIFVNQNPGLLRITGGIASGLGKPAAIVGVGTSWEHGQAIKRVLARAGGEVTVRLSVGGEFAPNTSYNVVAELPGSTHPEELIVVGAHYDGHDISQAALDDGTGTAVTLEVGRVLAMLPREAIGRTIRFVLFCGEEVGLYGSWQYVADNAAELPRIRFMLNLDGAGQGRGGGEILAISGRDELVPYFEALQRQMQQPMDIQNKLGAHSDHYPFAIRGIPTASLYGPDDTTSMVGRGWGHSEADTFDKVRQTGLQMAAMLVSRLLVRVASDEAFPAEVMPEAALREQLESLGQDIALKRSGKWDLIGKMPAEGG